MGKKLLRVFLAIILVAGFLAPIPSFAADEEIPGYEFRPLSLNEVEGFLAEVTHERADLEKALKDKYPDKPEKVTKHPDMTAYNQIIGDTSTLLLTVKNGHVGSDQERVFVKIQRLHYGVLADIGGAKQESLLKRIFDMGKNVAFGPVVLNVPNVIDPNAKLGPRLAKAEAARLYNRNNLVTADQLENMSALEVSRLQPSPKHQALSGKPVGNNFSAFLKEMTRLIRLCDKKFANFDFGFARRVMFFDELKDEATSPKITAKDRYGIKWKIKWGDEVHTDAAITRIYIDLGGSYTDVKFFSGPEDLILVLSAPQDQDKTAIKTFDEFASTMLKSKFKFHAFRYLLPNPVLKDKDGKVLGTGIVDEKMAEKESILPKYIGAYYVKFKESQVSMYNPAIARLGGASLSKIGAPEDRVVRGCLVFNAWVKNKDMKDDNSRVGLLFDPTSGKFDRLVEFQSDIGCSMGCLRTSGDLNHFEKSMIMYMPQSINFIMRPLYVPKAWKECTWADARWMALRIAEFTREDLERSFSECGWPPFAQKVAVEKLIGRRNELIKAFRLDLDGVKPLSCDNEFSYKVNGDDYPVKNGKINEKSALVKQLEETSHPEGLGEVIPRSND